MRILILGDAHGQTKWVVDKIRFAKRQGIKKIIQLGDWGIWTHEADGFGFLDAVNDELRRNGVKLYFLGGNHENWDHLNWWERNNPRTHNEHVIVRSHIFYTGRFNRWIWGMKGEERVFQAVSGAYSIDRAWRTLGKDFWLDETIPERVVSAIENANRKCDFLFTHDAPSSIPMNLKPDIESVIHRGLMDRIGRATRPNLWFHGHYHQWMEYGFNHQQGGAFVYGLDRDYQHYSHVILDTVSGNVTTASGKVIEHGD